MIAKRAKLWLLTFVLHAVLVAGCVSTEGRSDMDSGGTIVYAAAQGRSMDLWVTSPGEEPIRFTSTPRADEFDPAWSPDGRMIVFARRTLPNTFAEIWVMDADGTDGVPLTHDGEGAIDRQPSWSPDGGQVVWVRSYPSRMASELWVMQADGTGKQRLLPGAPVRYDASPDWSPDGGRIAFASNRPGGAPHIYTVRSDGRALRRLTDGQSMDGEPVWSPDGETIAFTRRTLSGRLDLWSMAADGGGGTRLTHGPEGEAQPAWDPSGRRLVFGRYPSGGGPIDLFISSAQGSPPSRLTSGQEIELSPDWGSGVIFPGPTVRRGSREMAEGSHGGGSGFALPSDVRSTRVRRDLRLHRFRAYRSDVHVLEARLDGGSTVDVALATGELAGRQATSQVAAQHHAIAAVNGDFAYPSGRPLHPFAEDGELMTTSLAPSTNFAVSSSEDAAYFGRPVEHLTVIRGSGGSWLFDRWNDGVPSFPETAAYSADGSDEDRPPKWACAARLLPLGDNRWAPQRAGVARDFRVDVVTCDAARLGIGEGVVLAARPTSEGAFLISSLRQRERITVTWSFGWRGVTDSIGGFPMLVRDGRVRVEPCGGLLCDLHPRTGVAVTSDRRLLLVVVDGRQEDSRGVTLVQFARIFRDLGVTTALNLDGGGSSTMVINGTVVNDPSGGEERPTSTALLILPGRDREETIRQS